MKWTLIRNNSKIKKINNQTNLFSGKNMGFLITFSLYLSGCIIFFTLS